MKKYFLFFITTFMFVGSVSANPNMNGGFVGPNAFDTNITTVDQVAKLRDDTNVIMQGKIINNLGDEKYTFADETGTIVIEIDNEDWNGITVTPETTVQIYGEVDKGLFKKTKIDVDSISVKQ